jgi:hypothetical protein
VTSSTRTVVLSLITVAFLGLAVAILVQSGPWYLSLAYVVCAAVTATVAWKVRPGRALPSDPRAPKGDPTRRARRSGNPALRAKADQPNDPSP